MNSVMEIGEKIVFLKDGLKSWEGTKEEIFNTENEAVTNFVYSSDLFKKVREVYHKDESDEEQTGTTSA
jgi:phospholipid/cholesterol/gamma-HCH transport system ATP-binding protein